MIRVCAAFIQNKICLNQRNPLQFDVFSIAMIFCQLLFNLLDERTDAAFRQQLVESKYDLDTWLARELSSTIRPVGLDDALIYLDERRGRIDYEYSSIMKFSTRHSD